MIRLENFYTGIFTEAGKIPAGVTTAADVSNLRVDKNGFMRPRIGTRNLGQPIAVTDPLVSGVANVGNLLFFSSNGYLYVSLDGGATNLRVVGVSGLEGRISVVGNFENFVILTSEGQDSGFWIDIGDMDAIEGYPLSFEAPDFTTTESTYHTAATSGPDRTKYYYYKFVYARAQDDATDDVPIGDMVGDASEVVESEPISEVPDPGDKIYRRFTVALPTWSGYSLITEIRLYRSEAYEEAESEPKNFKLVATVSSSATQVTDGKSDAEHSATGDNALAKFVPSLNFPSAATSIAYYNGRIFATCGEELRFNEVTRGNPKWYSWPAKNSIRRREVHFVFEYLGVLYFGDRAHTWRVSGIPETPSFGVEEVSNRGALDTYAATVLEQGVAIISESGLFVGNGVTWERVSKPLDEFFKTDVITDGHIMQLPNSDIVWSCKFISGRHRQFLMHLGGAAGVRWEAWHGVEALQSGRYLSSMVGVRGFSNTWVDNEGDHWLFGGANLKATSVVFADRGARLRELLWQDERSGESDESLDWFFQSHDVFYRQEALAMDEKVFRALLVRGKADGDVTLQFNLQGGVDDDDVIRMVEEVVTLRGGRPTQVPIRRHGESLSFRISGTGNCQIRGFYLEFDVERSLR